MYTKKWYTPTDNTGLSFGIQINFSTQKRWKSKFIVNLYFCIKIQKTKNKLYSDYVFNTLKKYANEHGSQKLSKIQSQFPHPKKSLPGTVNRNFQK